MGGLAANQANPYSSAVGCLMDGLPTNCNRVQQAINRGEAKKLIVDARGQNPNVVLASMGWFLVELPVTPRGRIRPRWRPKSPRPSPGNRDPFNVGSNEGSTTLEVRLVAFERRQNPIQRITETIKVPLVNLKKLLQDTLAYGDCADFLARLLTKAGELSNNAPVSTDLMDIYGMLNRQSRGGIQLNHEGPYYAYWGNGYQDRGQIEGGGGLADGYWGLQNRKIWIHQQEIPAAASARDHAQVPFRYAERVLHEFFHVAGKTDLYSHETMRDAALALEGLHFDSAIRKHCIPPH